MTALGLWWNALASTGSLTSLRAWRAKTASVTPQLHLHYNFVVISSHRVQVHDHLRYIILPCWGNCSPCVTRYILTGNNLWLLRISNVSHLNFIVKYIFHRTGVKWLVNASQRILLSLTSQTLNGMQIYPKWKVQIVQIPSLICNRAGYFLVDINVLLQVKLCLS